MSRKNSRSVLLIVAFAFSAHSIAR